MDFFYSPRSAKPWRTHSEPSSLIEKCRQWESNPRGWQEMAGTNTIGLYLLGLRIQNVYSPIKFTTGRALVSSFFDLFLLWKRMVDFGTSLDKGALGEHFREKYIYANLLRRRRENAEFRKERYCSPLSKSGNLAELFATYIRNIRVLQ